MRYLLIAFLLISFTSCAQTIYIVRHAEKGTPMANSSDVPLSAEGEARALALKEVLKNEKIEVIYSTNTIRTKTTAKPTADHFSLTIETYGPRPDSAFISMLKSSNKNILVVGHSNTIDDIANMLLGTTEAGGDLKDSDYDNLFIIKRKGDKFILKKETYGVPTE
jgi:broad specificity phosphatase PhoE